MFYRKINRIQSNYVKFFNTVERKKSQFHWIERELKDSVGIQGLKPLDDLLIGSFYQLCNTLYCRTKSNDILLVLSLHYLKGGLDSREYCKTGSRRLKGFLESSRLRLAEIKLKFIYFLISFLSTEGDCTHFD